MRFGSPSLAHRSERTPEPVTPTTVGGRGTPPGVDLDDGGFLRVVTHPKVFRGPGPLEAALAFVSQVRNQPNCVPVVPGPGHWNVFVDLVHGTGAKGNLVRDAYLAALAIESGLGVGDDGPGLRALPQPPLAASSRWASTHIVPAAP
jgi:hypothetical protein